MSATVLITSVTSFVGFLLNGTILYFVLSKGREKYHYLFAGFLFICALWDIGIFLSMIRNTYVNELQIYGQVIMWPCIFIFALIYHFTCSYLKRPRKKSTIFVWAFSTILFALGLTGVGGEIVGVYNHSWGNIYRPDSQLLTTFLAVTPIGFFFSLSALYFLFRAYKSDVEPLKKRHILYILVSFTVIHLAMSKIIILYDFDNGFIMPFCMFLNDIAAATIGIAIIKYRMFDITVIIKKTTVYSILLALIIFIFSFSEHMLVNFIGDIFGENSVLLHMTSIALVLALVLPVRQRIERAIGRFFSKKTVEF